MTDTTAFLFPGQGSQFIGMGATLVAQLDYAKEMLEEANDTLGFDLGRLIYDGSESDLSLTANTQPALLLISAICDRRLKEIGITPAIVAGHSLGEFSACYSAEVFSFRDALRIVRKRGELMQSAVPVGVGGMSAVIGLSSAEVAKICAENEGDVAPANFNSPEQTVIAGSAKEVIAVGEKMKEAGAKKVVPLSVSAPFHTPFMKPAQEGLKDFMADIRFHDPKIPVIRNVDAGISKTGDEVRTGLIKQVTDCVRWVDCFNRLVEYKITAGLEVGSGKVLCGLGRRIDRSVLMAPACEIDEIEKIAAKKEA